MDLFPLKMAHSISFMNSTQNYGIRLNRQTKKMYTYLKVSVTTTAKENHFQSSFGIVHTGGEAIEIVAKGDEYSSKVVGREIKALKLPPGTTIGAIVRGNEVIIAHSNTVIMEEDHVILFLVNKRFVSHVEKLFYVDAIYF
mgnify:CR=1 FL=1